MTTKKVSLLLITGIVAAFPVQADQVVTDDQIVQGALCVGFDCRTDGNEPFAADEVKVKENNVRLRMIDKSLPDQLGNSWNIEANDSRNGGNAYFDFQIKQARNESPFVLPQQAGVFPASQCSSLGQVFPAQVLDNNTQTFPALLTGGSIPVGSYALVPAPVAGTENCTFTPPSTLDCVADAVCTEGQAPVTEPEVVRARMEGTVPQSNCTAAGQIFAGQTYDPLTGTFPELSTGDSIPVGDAVLVPQPILAPFFCPGNVCDAVCVQSDVAVARSVLNFGTADAADTVFGNGVAVGFESALEPGVVSIGSAGLVRQLAHVAKSLASTDVLTLAAFDEINAQLDQIDEVVAIYENGGGAGDIDGDGNADIDDVRLIFGVRNQPTIAGDPRDVDGNGIITIRDARAFTRQCTLARCARL